MSIKITEIMGNSQSLDGGSMFGNAPRVLWERWVDVDAKHRIALACRCMLVEFAGKKILCEVGVGAFFSPHLKERYGVVEEEHILLKSLAEHNISHEQIDFVILSHLHFDHAGGLLPSYSDIKNGKTNLLFPNASYITSADAFNRAKSPHTRDRVSFIPEIITKLELSGRLLLVENREASLQNFFPDNISFRYSDGHTKGQLHTVVQGENSKVIFVGDLVPGTAWINPSITMGYDRYAEKVIDEKKQMYQEIVLEKDYLFFTHDTKCAMATIKQDEKFRYSPSIKKLSPVGFEI